MFFKNHDENHFFYDYPGIYLLQFPTNMWVELTLLLKHMIKRNPE